MQNCFQKPPFHDDRVPLVPSDFTSIDEALHNFVAVFEARQVFISLDDVL